MNTPQAEKLREYIDAQIEYMFAKREEDSDGYRCSAPGEQELADRAWAAFLSSLENQQGITALSTGPGPWFVGDPKKEK